jgi:hypothetical protein
MQIIALGTESKQPTVLDFSRFLYHVNRVYEVGRLATDPDYASFRFPLKNLPQAFSRLRVGTDCCWMECAMSLPGR